MSRSGRFWSWYSLTELDAMTRSAFIFERFVVSRSVMPAVK